MQKLKQAERDFIEELYNKEYKILFAYAKKVTAGASTAEDIVQDTFLMACTRIDTLINHPKPGAWLLVTLKNNIKNYKRVKDFLTKIFIDIPVEEWLAKYPSDKTAEDDLDLLYGNLVNYKEYEILKKFAVEGRSASLIAAEYGISPNTCRQRIFRAKKFLYQIYVEKEKNKIS